MGRLALVAVVGRTHLFPGNATTEDLPLKLVSDLARFFRCHDLWDPRWWRAAGWSGFPNGLALYFEGSGDDLGFRAVGVKGVVASA